MLGTCRTLAVGAMIAWAALGEPAGAQPSPSHPLLPPDTALVVPDTARADSAAAETTATDTLAAPRRDYLDEMRANFTAENRAYSGLKVAMRFLDPLYAILVGLLVLFSGLSASLRDVAHTMGRRLWVRILVYLGLYTLVVFVATIPLVWYDGFVLEHQFGLSNQSFGSWLGDQLKGLMVGIFFLGVVPILWLVYTVIARSPKRWWLWIGIGSLPVIVAGTLIQPLVVDPLFNEFSPLKDQRLEARILDLAARAGIPGRNVYQVDKSAQTKKFNAYVNGFGVSQRIVLWDTTLEGMEEDEILFVMGHEIGHYALRHIWKGIALSWLGSLVLLWISARIARAATNRFGERWGFTGLDDVASLPLLSLILAFLSFVSLPVANEVSRRIETESDLYGLEITRDNDAAARAFLKLGSQNKSNPEPSPFVRFVLYSHPTLSERVRLALAYRPWEEGRANRFYRGP
jgi:STE24 endopeptidase